MVTQMFQMSRGGGMLLDNFYNSYAQYLLRRILENRFLDYTVTYYYRISVFKVMLKNNVVFYIKNNIFV